MAMANVLVVSARADTDTRVLTAANLILELLCVLTIVDPMEHACSMNVFANLVLLVLHVMLPFHAQVAPMERFVVDMVSAIMVCANVHQDSKVRGAQKYPSAQMTAVSMVSVTWVRACANLVTLVNRVNFHLVVVIKYVRTVVFAVKVDAFVLMVTRAMYVSGWFPVLLRQQRNPNVLWMTVALNVVDMVNVLKDRHVPAKKGGLGKYATNPPWMILLQWKI
jgi:hypothetical protein